MDFETLPSAVSEPQHTCCSSSSCSSEGCCSRAPLSAASTSANNKSAPSQMMCAHHRCPVSSSASSSVAPQAQEADLYLEDDADVGPRAFLSSLSSYSTADASDSPNAVHLYNQAVMHHTRSEYLEAMRLYQHIIQTQNNSALRIQARNNLGHILYMAGISEEQALEEFQTALEEATTANNNANSNSSNISALEYATLLSNWCRVQWMNGDVSPAVYEGLYTVLSLRQQHLPATHVDIAAAHYNIGVTEYAHNDGPKALEHLRKYLELVATTTTTNTSTTLDPIPALIYILLIQNEDKASRDPMAQELVRGLRTLQEKREELQQQHQPHEVASVLNFIGTLLFHQRDFDHALLFFQEELRMEQAIVAAELIQDDISVAVTSNNIARILQEMGRLPEAKTYYYRALQHDYGNEIEALEQQTNKKTNKKSNTTSSLAAVLPSPNTPLESGKRISELPSSTINLYSTVWYNLGLIHDKQGTFRQAIRAFQMSLSLRMVMLGPDHADCACLLYNIGVLQMEQQLLVDATQSLKEALRIRRRSTTSAAAESQSQQPQGQLHDGHVVKTLQKLASLHKSKGNIAGALEAQREIGALQQSSQEFEQEFDRTKDMAFTTREMAELYHCQGNLPAAIQQVSFSVQNMRHVLSLSSAILSTTDLVSGLEELVAGLLLLGSLHHEICEPDMARALYQEASTTLQRASQCFDHATELDALQQVTTMLATCHCAPEA